MHQPQVSHTMNHLFDCIIYLLMLNNRVKLLTYLDKTCIAGTTGFTKVLNNVETVMQLQDLQVSDHIKGIDEDKNPAGNCEVAVLSKIGRGVVYGNYTRDHYNLDDADKDLVQHGEIGLAPEGDVTDVYQVLSSCPLTLDESGKKVRLNLLSIFIYKEDSI